MRSRVRAVWLAGAALVALIPSTGAAAYASPAPSRSAIARPLSWRVVPSPDRLADDELFGVTCLSARSCTAVGRGGGKTLVERWNGTAWSIVPSPNPDTGQDPDVLSSVSCVTAAFCAAVGEYGPADSAEPVTEIWNGHRWSLGPSQDRPSDPALYGVSCTSASACTAAGAYFDDAIDPPTEQTLIETGNSNGLSVVPSPNAGGAGTENVLTSVSCASRRACIAVGNASAGNVTSGGALIEAWNGTRWSIVPSHITRKAATVLDGVSCPSATMCMATGARYTSSSQDSGQTLTELGTSSG